MEIERLVKCPMENTEQEKGLRVAVVIASEHHQNTRAIAEVIAKALDADLLEASDQTPESLKRYHCIAFGSGIYFGKHHQSIIDLAESLTHPPKTAIVYSTAGLSWFSGWFHRPLLRALQQQGCRILGQFCCRGWDTVGPLFWVGGINRNHPNQKDLQNARSFAVRMMNKLAAKQ